MYVRSYTDVRVVWVQVNTTVDGVDICENQLFQ